MEKVFEIRMEIDEAENHEELLAIQTDIET